MSFDPVYGSAPGLRSGGMVFGLSRNVQVATLVAKSGKHCNMAVHNFDHAEALIAKMKTEAPALVAMDFDTCEAEAFKVLKELCSNAEFKHVAAIGYLSAGFKTPVREEAQRAGCQRVYTKTEFFKELDLILARYAK